MSVHSLRERDAFWDVRKTEESVLSGEFGRWG